MGVGVVLAHQARQFLAVARHPEALVHRIDQRHAASLVGDMAGPVRFAGESLAQVVQQAGPAYAERLPVAGALLQYRQDMDAGIDFRMVGRRLRYAE